MLPLKFKHHLSHMAATCLVSAGMFLLPQSAIVTTADAAICMYHENLVSFLSGRHNELPRALGLVADRGLMEVYVSPAGTWTIVMTTPTGVACVIAAGDTWEEQQIRADAGTEF
ncbi:MAG: hypothetical protein JKY32_11980 [Rhizobiales bacterium]|nr:hypothetical protein [Hyphomicrobiales bacterium]